MDRRIERPLITNDAGDHVAEERRIRIPILVAIDFPAKAVLLEFGEDVGKRHPGKFHLVERLHGGEARGAALVRWLRRFAAVAHRSRPRRRRVAIIARAASAAAPPLFFSATRARAQAWSG